jgi:hypothetical protein
MRKKMIGTFVAVAGILVLWSVWGYFGSRVEQADYVVLRRADGYEVREYPARIVAQTTVAGAHDESMGEGFRIVAGYIFGGNTRREVIAMTAPVFAEARGAASGSENIAMTAPVVVSPEGESQVVSFGMPRAYTLDTLPTPSDPRVKIVALPAKRYAVASFSWYRSDARVARAKEALLSALARDGVTVKEGVAYAGYSAPWTPPWMLRNEVLVEVAG